MIISRSSCSFCRSRCCCCHPSSSRRKSFLSFVSVAVAVLIAALLLSNSGSSQHASAPRGPTAGEATAAPGPSSSTPENKVLAVFFSNIDAGDLPVVKLLPELSERVKNALSLEHSSSISFSDSAAAAAPGDSDSSADSADGSATIDAQISSYLTFTVSEGNLTVKSSIETPETYLKYSTIWKNMLRNSQDLKNPFQIHSRTASETAGPQQVFILADRYEAVLPPVTPVTPATVLLSMQPTEEELEEERRLSKCSNSTKRNELFKNLGSRVELMQLRLKDTQLEDYAKSFEKLSSLARGCQIAAASILGVPEENIYFVDIKEGSIVAQFSVHPAAEAELQRFSNLWAEGMKTRHPILKQHFQGDIDYDFPPVDFSNGEDPDESTAKSNGSHRGIITGVILGSLVLAVVLCGGGASYMYRKHGSSDDRENSSAAAAAGKQIGNIDEAPLAAHSPATSLIMSPKGLRDVVIRGSTTPNVHNYRN